MITKTAALLLALAATATGLSERWAAWPDSPEGLFLTPDERREWKKIPTDAAALTFVEAFWRRRDPDPETPVNELRSAALSRAVEADRNFGYDGKPGSLSDRGRVLILLGEPDAVRTHTSAAPLGNGSESQSYGNQGAGAYEVWFYSSKSLPVKVPAKQVEFVFLETRPGLKDFGLARHEPANRMALVALARAPEAHLQK